MQLQLTTDPVSIKDKRKLIRAKLHVWFTSRSGPAYSHVSSCHSLKLKVPAPSLHRIRPLYSEETDLVNAESLNHLSYRVEETATMPGCRTTVSEPHPAKKKITYISINCKKKKIKLI